MTEVAKKAVAKELAGYFDQMRQSISPRAGFVGSVSLSTGYDHRFGTTDLVHSILCKSFTPVSSDTLPLICERGRKI
jgi:hypothetical protein